MNDMLKELDTLYDDMSEAKAEGSTSGYSEKLPNCILIFYAACHINRSDLTPATVRLTVEVKTYFMKAQKLKLVYISARSIHHVTYVVREHSN